jgi:hypothetical protein
MLSKIYKKLVLWVMGTRLYYLLLKNVIPYIRFTTYYTSLRGWKYHMLYGFLEPGDIILTIDKKKLTTLLIPGEFSHAAMCISKNGEWEVSEMTHTDYTKSCFFDICKESDRVLVLGVKNSTYEEIQEAIRKCKSFSNAKYDVEFKLGVEALYCSELCYKSWGNDKLQASLEDLAGLGRPYISPTSLYKAKGVYIKIDSDDLKWLSCEGDYCKK